MLPEAEVPYEAAYSAAMTRLERMTVAIVQSEAHRLVLETRCARLAAEVERLRAELEEVTCDAESTEDGAEAGGEADSSPPFSD